MELRGSGTNKKMYATTLAVHEKSKFRGWY
jgi:hypothetical protein